LKGLPNGEEIFRKLRNAVAAIHGNGKFIAESPTNRFLSRFVFIIAKKF
jgi:hypothetical protein